MGKIVARVIDVYRSSLGGAWQALAQQIVMSVELSAARRKEYEFAWPDERFMTAICSAKDGVVHVSSLVTSLIGAVGISIHQKRVDYISTRAGQIDSRFNARFTMSLMAMTNFISSVIIYPLYSYMALRRMISCGVNGALPT
jgi:hypothetical protein